MALINLNPAALLSDINSGLNLLSNFINSDTIAIYDEETFTQVFADANPMRATVNETSRVMDYPVESGAILSDHHIINPIAIEIALLIYADDYASMYQQIRSAWQKATSLSVQTRTGIYSSMIIAEMPHEENTDMADAIILTLRMRQVILILPSTDTQPSNYQPLNPIDSNTVSRGLQFAKSLVTTTLSFKGYIKAASVWGIKL